MPLETAIADQEDSDAPQSLPKKKITAQPNSADVFPRKNEAMRKRVRDIPLQSSIVLTATFLCSCMTTQNEQEVADRDEEIGFAGYAFDSHGSVSVQALRHSDGEWIEIGAPVPNSSPRYNWLGQNLHAWSERAQIPSWGWSPGGIWGAEAKVRTIMAGAYQAATFDDPTHVVNRCVYESSSWAEVNRDCTSEDNGILTVKTVDFLDVVMPPPRGDIQRCDRLEDFWVACSYRFPGESFRRSHEPYLIGRVRPVYSDGTQGEIIVEGCLGEGAKLNTRNTPNPGCTTTTFAASVSSTGNSRCVSNKWWSNGEVDIICHQHFPNP